MAGRKKRHVASPAARRAALRGRPFPVPPVRTEEKQEKLLVTIRFLRPRWQRWLGAAETAERTFGLDAYGRYVYEGCNGKRTVQSMIKRFARDQHLSVPEAEIAVTKFMQTLMTKGLVVMDMEK